jgi:predicted MFS family arabinose efflux permease
MTAPIRSEASSAVRRGVGWAIAMLFLTSVLNLLDRQIVNVLAQSIKTELHISDAQLGLLTGTAFGVLYALLGVPLGRAADLVNRVWLIALALVAWSGFTIATGAAATFPQLLAARTGVGVGEAAIQPASTALVRDLVSERRRASAMSLLLFGAPVGAFLGLLGGGWIGAQFGWRVALYAAGAPGILLGLVVLATVRDPRAAGAKPVPAPPFFATLGRLISDSRLRRLTLGLLCATFLVYAGGAWLPAFFMRVHHLTLGEIGLPAAIAVGVGGGLGTLGGGMISDLLRPRLREVELKVLIAALLCAVPALVATLFLRDTGYALAAMAVYYVFAYAYLGPIVVLIQRQADDRTRAVAIGLCIAVSNIVTLGLGVPLVGMLSDALKSNYGASSIGYALAWTVAPTAVLGVLAFLRAGAIPSRET